MKTTRLPYDIFLGEPSEVLSGLGEVPVVLEREDDENLVLMWAEGYKANTDALRVTVSALANVARRDADLVKEVLGEELSWLPLLPESERHRCMQELLDLLLAVAETGDSVPFVRALASWSSTTM
ncbi:hypothetical protein [Sphaerisporangium sp. NPDC051011]|uniref:hypothetical protein n=1 Tax=Sphaerisporangium sp. NPDC051011 TaxID=3155792 RepID=UPI0033EEB806